MDFIKIEFDCELSDDEINQISSVLNKIQVEPVIVSKNKEEVGVANCFFCGGALIWDSDFDYADYFIQGSGIVANLHCPHCGTEVRSVTRDYNRKRRDPCQTKLKQWGVKYK